MEGTFSPSLPTFRPSGLLGGGIPAAASMATTYKSRKLQVDTSQPGPGGSSVPKGTLLK